MEAKPPISIKVVAIPLNISPRLTTRNPLNQIFGEMLLFLFLILFLCWTLNCVELGTNSMNTKWSGSSQPCEFVTPYLLEPLDFTPRLLDYEISIAATADGDEEDDEEDITHLRKTFTVPSKYFEEASAVGPVDDPFAPYKRSKITDREDEYKVATNCRVIFNLPVLSISSFMCIRDHTICLYSKYPQAQRFKRIISPERLDPFAEVPHILKLEVFVQQSVNLIHALMLAQLCFIFFISIFSSLHHCSRGVA